MDRYIPRVAGSYSAFHPRLRSDSSIRNSPPIAVPSLDSLLCGYVTKPLVRKCCVAGLQARVQRYSIFRPSDALFLDSCRFWLFVKLTFCGKSPPLSCQVFSYLKRFYIRQRGGGFSWCIGLCGVDTNKSHSCGEWLLRLMTLKDF